MEAQVTFMLSACALGLSLIAAGLALWALNRKRAPSGLESAPEPEQTYEAEPEDGGHMDPHAFSGFTNSRRR